MSLLVIVGRSGLGQGQCQDRYGAAERSVPARSEAVQRLIMGRVSTRNLRHTVHHGAPWLNTAEITSFVFRASGHLDFGSALTAQSDEFKDKGSFHRSYSRLLDVNT